MVYCIRNCQTNPCRPTNKSPDKKKLNWKTRKLTLSTRRGHPRATSGLGSLIHNHRLFPSLQDCAAGSCRGRGKMETQRRWDELPMDCLVHVFERLGLEDKSLGVPFVCKSWYEASLSPVCWRVLDFRSIDFEPDGPFADRFQREYRLSATFSFSGFLRFTVNRSRRSATAIYFPDTPFEIMEPDGLDDPDFTSTFRRFSLDDLIYISDECPALKIFRWCCPGEEVRRHVSKYIHKWKNLEQLFMKIRPSCFVEVVSEISHNCKNFTGLTARSYLTESDARAIVKFLPKIKYLDLSNSFVSKDILPIILDGCKELEEFYVRNCTAFEVDDEILRKASRLKVFKYDGSEICVDHFSRLFVHVREQIAIILSNYLSDNSSDED